MEGTRTCGWINTRYILVGYELGDNQLTHLAHRTPLLGSSGWDAGRFFVAGDAGPPGVLIPTKKGPRFGQGLGAGLGHVGQGGVLVDMLFIQIGVRVHVYYIYIKA